VSCPNDIRASDPRAVEFDAWETVLILVCPETCRVSWGYSAVPRGSKTFDRRSERIMRTAISLVLKWSIRSTSTKGLTQCVTLFPSQLPQAPIPCNLQTRHIAQ
jgi:hypothetical protein